MTLAKEQPRRRLTLRDMVTIAQRQVAAPILCCLCQQPLGDGPVIDEHLVARGIGGREETENRGIAHKNCSSIKTHGAPTKTSGRGSDATEIARTKRLAAANDALKRLRDLTIAPLEQEIARERRKAKIPSRPFPKRQKSAPGTKQRM